MRLSKFPVTSPSGNEYRVTVKKCYRSYFGYYYLAVVYTERRGGWLSKLKRFKRIVGYEYDYTCSDFVQVATDAVLRREVQHAKQLAEEAEARELADRKRRSAEAFATWDGIITEGDAE